MQHQEPAVEFRAGDNGPSRVGLMATVFDELDQLAALSPNWDSLGSDAPTQPARRCARVILEQIVDRFGTSAGRLAEPSAVAAMPGSGVLLEWRGEHANLEVDIGPGGGIGYLFVDRRCGGRRAEEADAVSLATILSRLAVVLNPGP